MILRLSARLAAALAMAALAVTAAPAQSDAPVTLLVGYSAGGSADFAARLVAPEISSRIGRPVVVENATGASGMIAFQRLVGGGEGDTLYYGGFDTVAVPLVNDKVELDWVRDTTPIGRTATTSMALVVLADKPYADLPAFIAAAADDPETLTYGTPGIASAQHFFGEMIASRAGVKLVHAPYRGGAQVTNDLLGGVLDTAVLSLSTALPLVKEGKVRVLAVSGAERAPQIPDAPALAEIKGFEGLSLPLWQGIFAKKGAPEELAKPVAAALDEALADAALRKRFADAGFTAAPLAGDAFSAFIEAQAKVYRQITDSAAIKVEE